MIKSKLILNAAGALVSAGLVAGGVIVLSGEEDAVEPQLVYVLPAASLAAVRACADSPGCTADVQAIIPDGGVVRLAVRATADGTFVPVDSKDVLHLDGGVLK